MSERCNRVGIEFHHQVALVQWARNMAIAYDELACLEWLYANPMGEKRGSTRAEAQKIGDKIRKMGGIAGMPDLCLPVARNGYTHFYIELKAPGEKPRENQLKSHAFLASEGAKVGVYDQWWDAAQAILEYLNVPLSDLYVAW